MRRMLALIGALVVGTLCQTAAFAQESKSVEGTISAIGPSSITVKVNEKDMTFNVDAKTDITTPGGSTKTRAAEAQGKAGLKIADYLKVGQTVSVRYRDPGMVAETIRTLAGAPRAAAPAGTTGPKTQTASGIVAKVTGTSITIKTAGGETTFNVDDKTEVVGTGAGTLTREKKAAGQKPVLTDFVGAGDTVVVTYHESGSAKQASEIRVRTKGRG